MKSSPRATFALTIGVASMALLSGCGSSDGEAAGSSDTLNYVPTTSYALKAPATTTTTTTLPAGETPAGGTVPTEQTYTIQSGDSLSAIASRFDVTMDAIVAYNGWTDGINHVLLPGDTILIPPGSASPGAAQTPSSGDSTDSDSSETADSGETEEASGTGCTHTIVSGDNPTRVANQYDITVDQLSNANLNNPVWNTFLVGSTLNIPPEGNC
jgi:LysM repeat protein